MRGIIEKGAAPLFLCELARKVRTLLDRPEIRSKVDETIREISETLKQCPLRVTAEGWPFPIEYGIEEAPGCILALVAINEFAAQNPKLFRQDGVVFKQVWPEEKFTGPGIVFFMQWTQAVDKIRRGHSERLVRIVQRAIDELSAADEVAPNLVTIADMATLAGLERKTIVNRLAEARKAREEVPNPVQESCGKNPAKYDYKKLRLVLVSMFPKRANCFSESFDDVEARLAKFT